MGMNSEWITYYLERELAQDLDNYAGSSVYFGGKNLMAYAQLCLVASEIGRYLFPALLHSSITSL